MVNIEVLQLELERLIIVEVIKDVVPKTQQEDLTTHRQYYIADSDDET